MLVRFFCTAQAQCSHSAALTLLGVGWITGEGGPVLLIEHFGNFKLRAFEHLLGRRVLVHDRIGNVQQHRRVELERLRRILSKVLAEDPLSALSASDIRRSAIAQHKRVWK